MIEDNLAVAVGAFPGVANAWVFPSIRDSHKRPFTPAGLFVIHVMQASKLYRKPGGGGGYKCVFMDNFVYAVQLVQVTLRGSTAADVRR